MLMVLLKKVRSRNFECSLERFKALVTENDKLTSGTAQKAECIVNEKTALIDNGQLAFVFDQITFKVAQDMVNNATVCIRLYFISLTYEAVVFDCSTIKKFHLEIEFI